MDVLFSKTGKDQVICLYYAYLTDEKKSGIVNYFESINFLENN